MAAPLLAPVIQGTGGIRKMRFSPPGWNVGKSGAVRVIYAVFPDFSVCVLAAAYAKTEQENISASDKKALKALVEEIESALKREES